LKIEEIKELYTSYQDAWSENREEAADDLKFGRLGEQWPDEVENERKQEARPMLTINRLPSFIRQVVNDARMNTPAIKCKPATEDATDDTAEIYNGLIRNIEYVSCADQAYDTALDNAASCGMGFWRVNVDYADNKSFDKEISIERIANPLSVYPDPSSMMADGSDWMGCFITEQISKAEFEQRFPGKDVSQWEGDSDETWITEEDVRIAEFWHLEEVDDTLYKLADGTDILKSEYDEMAEALTKQTGIEVELLVETMPEYAIADERDTKRKKLTQYLLNGHEILEENEQPGQYIPVIMVMGEEIIVEGKKHYLSLIRHAKDSQRMYNYWRTTATELVALAPKAPFIGPEGSFDVDSEKWATANSKTHAFLEYSGDIPPQRQPFAGLPAGAVNEAMVAADDMKAIMGIFDSSLGEQSNEIAGIAINARKNESDTSTFHFVDNLSRAIQHTGRVLIDLIPIVYSEPRIMRIMGIDGEVENVQINQEFEAGKQEDGSPIKKIHRLGVGKYDLAVEAGPSFNTKRQEAVTSMMDMLKIRPELGAVIGDLVAKNLDFPGAEEIANRLKAMLPPEIQNLEKVDSLPAEAQVAVSKAQTEVERMSKILEEGTQLLQAKDAEIAELYRIQNDKQAELEFKERDSVRKHEASMKDIEMDGAVASMKAREGERMEILKGLIEEIRNAMNPEPKVANYG